MVFDVESVGLHGEGFAVGWVVINCSGTVHAGGRHCCHPDTARGDIAGRAWVRNNVKIPECGDWIDTDKGTWRNPVQVRTAFWREWQHWKREGAVLVADCGWPVEARFLAACVDDDQTRREWEGPYPMHELASIRLAAGLNPLGAEERLPDELPAHDPLCDARQSARLLVEALRKIRGEQPVGAK